MVFSSNVTLRDAARLNGALCYCQVLLSITAPARLPFISAPFCVTEACSSPAGPQVGEFAIVVIMRAGAPLAPTTVVESESSMGRDNE